MFNIKEYNNSFNIDEYKEECFEHLANVLKNIDYDDINYASVYDFVDMDYFNKITNNLTSKFNNIKKIDIEIDEVNEKLQKYIKDTPLEGKHTIKFCEQNVECDKLRSVFGYGEFPFMTIQIIEIDNIQYIFYHLDG